MSPAAIDSVEPAYSYSLGGPNGREAHLRGARIHVRPVAGLSRESIARSLECHQARVTLGLEKPRSGDPYALPGGWLSIAVDSEGDAFVVVVQTNDHGDANRLLERAQLFAAARDNK